MVVLVDKTRAVDITIREWGDEHGYGSDWSAAALDVGGMQEIPSLADWSDDELAKLGLPSRSDIRLEDVLDEHGDVLALLNAGKVGYVIEDYGVSAGIVVKDNGVSSCIDGINDMIAGVGIYAGCGPQPNLVVDVTELDRGMYPKL